MKRVDVKGVLTRLGIKFVARGKRLWASCPNHTERTPSWSMWDDPAEPWHGHHVCFGCGFTGWPDTLVAHIDGCTPKEAAQRIEQDMVQQPLPDAIDVEVSDKLTRHNFELPNEIKFGPIDSWPTPPRRYIESRNVPEWQIARWGLGYAIAGDQQGRIVVPVRTEEGVLVGYTGRTFTGHRTRYKTSKGATPGIFHGEEHWTNRAMVIVTEGTFDSFAIERALTSGGTYRPNVAAVWGSQVLPAHLAKLSNFALVVVATDPDRAGDAAFEAFAGALCRHTEVRRMVFPAGSDAAELDDDALLTVFLGAL